MALDRVKDGIKEAEEEKAHAASEYARKTAEAKGRLDAAKETLEAHKMELKFMKEDNKARVATAEIKVRG